MTAAFHFWLLAALVPFPVAQVGDDPNPLSVIPVLRDGERIADLQRMEYSPDGRHLVVRRTANAAGGLSGDALLEVYSAATGKLVRSVQIDHGGNGFRDAGGAGFAISPASDWVVYGDRQGLNFVSLPPHRREVPGGRAVSAKSASGGFTRSGVWVRGDGAAYVEHWSGGSYSLHRVDTPDANPARADLLLCGGHPLQLPADVASALNPAAGRFVAVLDAGVLARPSLECWTLGAKPVKTTIGVHRRASVVALAPDGRTAACGFLDGAVSWHDTDTGRLIRRLPPLGRFGVFGLAFHPTGKFFAAGTTDKRGQHNLFVVNPATGEVVARLVADPKGVGGVCFSPTGDRLATFGVSGEIRIWNATALLKLERN